MLSSRLSRPIGRCHHGGRALAPRVLVGQKQLPLLRVRYKEQHAEDLDEQYILLPLDPTEVR